MLNHYLLRRRYRILFAAACIVIAFITFSFTEKGGSSDNSFPGFYEKGAQDETDTIPKRKSRKRSAMDHTNNTDSRTIDEQIEEALERVEEKLERLEIELSRRNEERPLKRAYELAITDINLDRVRDATQRSLQMAQMQYNKAMRKYEIENRVMMKDMQLQMDKARQLALNYNKDLRLNIESKVKINLEKAKENMLRAQEQLNKLKDFRRDLEKDGLIKKDAPYSIEVKDGDLFINGEKQSKRVNKKYREKYEEYFKEGSNFKIQSNSNEDKKRREAELI